MSPAIRTDITREYTAIIPAMTTGMRDCRCRIQLRNCNHQQSVVLTFMIRSGLKVPTPAIPMPDFAVPYAAPMPVHIL